MIRQVPVTTFFLLAVLTAFVACEQKSVDRQADIGADDSEASTGQFDCSELNVLFHQFLAPYVEDLLSELNASNYTLFGDLLTSECLLVITTPELTQQDILYSLRGKGAILDKISDPTSIVHEAVIGFGQSDYQLNQEGTGEYSVLCTHPVSSLEKSRGSVEFPIGLGFTRRFHVGVLAGEPRITNITILLPLAFFARHATVVPQAPLDAASEFPELGR